MKKMASPSMSTHCLSARSTNFPKEWVRFALFAAMLFILAFFAGCKSASVAQTHQCGVNSANDIFGIYSSTITGKNFKCIITDPYRELNHVRVSPDRRMITFTRFNKKKLFSGLAEEKNGYTDTEIMIANIDGTGIKSLTGHSKFIVNVNSYWTPDGKGLIYMSNDNPDKKTLRIKYIDLKTHKITNITPAYLPWVSDPQMVKDKLVFPASRSADKSAVRSIWIMNLKKKEARQLTRPDRIRLGKKRGLPPAGDSDPKLSPDGKKVAFTRHMGDGSFHTIVMDLTTGRERDLSEPGAIDVMPEWSSDGRLLTYWHVDMKNLSKIGIYVIRPDGSGRRQVPLPKGYHFKMPSFFPGDGSGPNARIIFSGKKVPQIK